MHMHFKMIIKANVCMHKVDLAAVPCRCPLSLSLSVLEFCSSSSFFSSYHLSFGFCFMFSLFLPSSFTVSDSNAVSHLSCYTFPFTVT